MRLREVIELQNAVGPASEGHSTFPAHKHPEQLVALNRRELQKGGPDRGGVSAGGPGSGRHKESWQMTKEEYLKHTVTPEGLASKKKQVGNLTLRQYHEQEHEKAVGGALYDGLSVPKRVRDQYPHMVAYVAKIKSVKADAAGTQTQGTFSTVRRYKLLNQHGTVIDSYDTYEEAKKAGAGNTYSRVVPYKPSDDSDSMKVKNKIRMPKHRSGRRNPGLDLGIAN